MKPLKTRWMTTISASVPMRVGQVLGPLVGIRCVRVGCRRRRRCAATGSSAMPMMVITVPVTTGGKNRISLAKYGAMKKVNSPATITAP